jgi:hypothetical protein
MKIERGKGGGTHWQRPPPSGTTGLSAVREKTMARAHGFMEIIFPSSPTLPALTRLLTDGNQDDAKRPTGPGV